MFLFQGITEDSYKVFIGFEIVTPVANIGLNRNRHKEDWRKYVTVTEMAHTGSINELKLKNIKIFF